MKTIPPRRRRRFATAGSAPATSVISTLTDILFIVGRSKEVIKRGGLQVAPAEVEGILLCHPDVIEAVAFSVPHERLGEDVAVAIVTRPDAEVSPHQIRSFARERLSSYKVPGLVHVVPAIPKNSTGKVNRSGMAAALGIGSPTPHADGGSMPPRSDVEAALAAMWGEILEAGQIAADQDIFALGADSLAVTQMLSRVREHFGVALSFEDIFEFAERRRARGEAPILGSGTRCAAFRSRS